MEQNGELRSAGLLRESGYSAINRRLARRSLSRLRSVTSLRPSTYAPINVAKVSATRYTVRGSSSQWRLRLMLTRWCLAVGIFLILTAEIIFMCLYWDRPLTDAGSVAERLTTPSWEVTEGLPLIFFFDLFDIGSPSESFRVNSIWTFYANGNMQAGDVDESGICYVDFLWSGPFTWQWSVDGDALTMSMNSRQNDGEYKKETRSFRILQCTESDLELEELDGSANEGTRRTLALTSRSRVISSHLRRLYIYGLLLGPYAAVVIAHVGGRRLARNKWLVFIACWLGTILIGMLIGSGVSYYDDLYNPGIVGPPFVLFSGALVFGFICVIPGLINGVVAMRRPLLDVPIKSLYKKYNRSE